MTGAAGSSARQPKGCVLLTGATGYVGGRLGPRLLAAGYRVRCLVRSARKLQARAWADHRGVEIVEVDWEDTDAMVSALRDCDAAYYLIHSMEVAGMDYAERDRRLAEAFAGAAAAAGVGRIVYLGGLGETGEGLSEHLGSRREVERVLAAGPVPVTILRAAVIIGSGSASFGILRYLVERLPVMITPKWVSTECQPIAIRDVLYYLVHCLQVPETAGETLDIGGPDVLSYRQLIQIMARELGLRRRLIVPVPVLTPRLSSLWIHLVTPVSYRVARPLADGLRNRVVCRDDRARRLMPHECLSATAGIRAAVGQASEAAVETAWSDAGVIPGDPDWAGGKVFVDERSTPVAASAEQTFAAVCRLGGDRGYFATDFLWRLRGAMDRLVGGPGLRRGRRHPQELAFGDALDFWRVTALEASRRLCLRAEMKLPGAATLEFCVEDGGADGGGSCTLVQTARFKPRGLAGLLYWYAVLPLHGFVFRGMLQGLRREAEATVTGTPPKPAGKTVGIHAA